MALFGGKIGSHSRTGGLRPSGTASAVKGIHGNAGKGSTGMDLRNMSKGQTFEGTVTAIKGKSVTIESDGHYLNARMEDSVSISIGEKISFVIRANQDSRIEIAPLRMGNISMEELVQYKALETAGLEANERNMEIVKGLMKYQMALNKDSIFHILGYLMKYPNLQVEDVLLMKRISNHIEDIAIYQYGQKQIEKKENDNIKFVVELKTKHLGIITIYIQWKEEKSARQKKLYLLFQTETEQIKKFLQEQENQWKKQIEESSIICEREYISIENECKNNQMIRMISQNFFEQFSIKGRKPENGKDKLYIQKMDLL